MKFESHNTFCRLKIPLYKWRPYSQGVSALNKVLLKGVRSSTYYGVLSRFIRVLDTAGPAAKKSIWTKIDTDIGFIRIENGAASICVINFIQLIMFLL